MPDYDETEDSAPKARGRRWFSPARLRILWPLLLLLLGFFAGLSLLAVRQSETSPPVTSAEIGPAVSTAVAKAMSKPALSAQVYQTILPSLVYIRTADKTDSDGGFGVGTGVIVNKDGSILTAYHVVDGASTINVIFADGTRATAQIAGSDPARDLAVLKADGAPEVIVPAALAGSGRVQVGDEAFAVGNPLGLVASLSAGVISGLDRQITKRGGGGTLDGLIQFDAAVNPGNSGGPLLNRAGQVIGIVTALANPSNVNSFTGIGFAVPLGTAGGAGGGPPR
jgi:S1-C subfamily serine protease